MVSIGLDVAIRILHIKEGDQTVLDTHETNKDYVNDKDNRKVA